MRTTLKPAAQRRGRITIAAPRPAPDMHSKHTEQRPMSLRPGALDFLQWPSRINDRRHYRDGRVEMVKP